jgi:hypothetical protein
MINEIENAIVTLLTNQLAAAHKIAVQKGVAGLTQPAVYASVEAGSFERISNSTVKQAVTVYLDIIFSSLKDQKARREGVNLILEGAVQLLLMNSLGLAVHPLMPKNWRNTTTTELDELGLISYSLELATSYHLTKLSDDEINDLITIGVSYLLTPGDTDIDGADTVTTLVEA